MTTRTETAKATVWTRKAKQLANNTRGQKAKKKFVDVLCRGSPGKLTSLKTERHVSVNNPTHNDQKRRNAQRNLNTGANSHTHGEVHLITHRHDNSSNVLSSITDNGDENQTNEGLANVHALDNVVDAADEVICANGDKDGDDNEDHAGGNGAQDGFFVLNGL